MITDFEIVDHGLESSDYFLGCGVSFTPYEHCVTGCGDNPREAMDDLFEQVSMEHDLGDLEERVAKELLAPNGMRNYPTTPESRHDMEYYYISIRFNIKR